MAGAGAGAWGGGGVGSGGGDDTCKAWVAQLVMNKLADVAMLPFYCQNTLVALLLINFKLAWSYIFKMRITCINKRFYNF